MTVIDEKTRVPLSLVLGAIGFVVAIVLAWAALSNAVAQAARKNEEQDREISRLIELKSDIAVISAKQSTAIEEIRELQSLVRRR
jgi:hypothetical protein